MTPKNSKTRLLLLFLFLQNQNAHLSLSLPLRFSLHHHSTPAPPWLHLLSQPNLDSRCLKSQSEIEIHCWLPTVPTRSTFFSLEKAQNRLSRCFQPPASEVLSTSNTWRCKKVFFLLFWIYFLNFSIYICVLFCFVLIL